MSEISVMHGFCCRSVEQQRSKHRDDDDDDDDDDGSEEQQRREKEGEEARARGNERTGTEEARYELLLHHLFDRNFTYI